jgi:Ser/Thr protein kinase RdoA (MazF antagonist)
MTAYESRPDFSAELQAVVERAYGLPVRNAKALTGGFESAVYRLDCGKGVRVMRVGPQWRSSNALHASYLAAAHVSKSMPEVPAPCPTGTGALVTRHADKPLSLWAYIEGRNLDPANEAEVYLAAATLARLHRELRGAPLGGHIGQTHPRDQKARESTEPETIKDDDLDRWVLNRYATRPMGPTHGDYWYNNLIVKDEKIVGILDWDDARIASVERELSSAVWEFCADPVRGTLNAAQVTEFLDLYAKHGGPVLLSDRTFIMPFIRDHLRSEIRQALASGGDIEGGSLEVSLRAFADSRRWSIWS